MLHDFLIVNRADLIERCRMKVALRRAPKATPAELENGIPLFLDQLIDTLKLEQASEPMRSYVVSGPSGGGPATSEIGTTATLHGRELLQEGFTVDQVVHDYGDLCQSITELAFEQNAPIEVNEFRTLNRCLDNGIANAVTEFGHQRQTITSKKEVQDLNERLGLLAHELRNYLQTATLAVAALKLGNVGISGPTGALLDRSLIGLRSLIDRSLADVRVTAGLQSSDESISLATFIADIRISAALEAQQRQCGLTVAVTDPTLSVKGDRELLFAAVGNLLQNAFKFTKPGTSVLLTARAAGDRILIEVEDRCGGLPPGSAEKMFTAFEQSSADRSGLGLGLSICRRSVEANNGVVSVQDKPGTGCVFTIDLPRQ